MAWQAVMDSREGGKEGGDPPSLPALNLLKPTKPDNYALSETLYGFLSLTHSYCMQANPATQLLSLRSGGCPGQQFFEPSSPTYSCQAFLVGRSTLRLLIVIVQLWGSWATITVTLVVVLEG